MRDSGRLGCRAHASYRADEVIECCTGRWRRGRLGRCSARATGWAHARALVQTYCCTGRNWHDPDNLADATTLVRTLGGNCRAGKVCGL